MADIEPISLTIGELTHEHDGLYGWMPADRPTGKRWITVDGIRRWTVDEIERTGIFTRHDSRSVWAGEEWSGPSDTPITLIRRVHPRRKSTKEYR